jgi:signal transduction histidine kinase
MFVPLRTRADSLGVLSFYSIHREFTDDDLQLAGELARRATLAIDNARLYEQMKRATIAREEVLSVVSHDLRNPLSAVAMAATTLLEHPPESEDKRRALYSMISDAASWMHRLMQDLLDAGAIDAGRLSIELERGSLLDIVEASVNQLRPSAAKHAVALEADLDPSLPLLRVDATRILQVLGNLIGNAVKFTPSGGSIVVRAVHRPNDVLLSVSDTGSGIDAAQLPHIFDRYWQARQGSQTRGTGLGLAIAKGIIEAHGGRIWAESIVGSGSTFLFTLPKDGIQSHGG